MEKLELSYLVGESTNGKTTLENGEAVAQNVKCTLTIWLSTFLLLDNQEIWKHVSTEQE